MFDFFNPPLFSPPANNFVVQTGPSLRAWLAAQAMNGMLSYSLSDKMMGNWQNNASPADVAKRAVEYADALIVELNREK